jgi:hypothetical protein
MSLAIELPDEYESRIESGETTFTYQLVDEIKVGSEITLVAGSARRKVRVTSKRWVPETKMQGEVREKILTIAPPREKGFSGAFQIGFEYMDGASPEPRQKYGDDIDKVAGKVEEV